MGARLGTTAHVPEHAEVANAVLFLAGEQSSYMTGSELFVDGGEVQVYA